MTMLNGLLLTQVFSQEFNDSTDLKALLFNLESRPFRAFYELHLNWIIFNIDKDRY